MRASLIALLLTPCTLATADTIHLTSGSKIDDVKIQTEGMDVVVYREGRKNSEVASKDVDRIVYTTKPDLIDQADAAANKGDWGNAIGDLEAYLAENDEPERNFKWARDYALFQRLEYFSYIGTPEQVIEAANDLFSLAPESRHVPTGHTIKADILFLAGDAAGARAALGPFKALIDGRALGERWLLEHDLRGVLFDTNLSGDALQTKLTSLDSRARGGYPIIRSRVQVAIAEGHLVAGKLGEAESIFREVTLSKTASDGSLAAAYYGLGRCLYEAAAAKSASGKDASEDFQTALLALLRVTVVYEMHRQYVPAAFYYAGRSFDGMGDEQSLARAQSMYRKVIARFPDSRWAREAKAFRRG